MSDSTCVYALHVATTPEKLWDALTRSEFWQEYWDGEWGVESDWEPGSPVHFTSRDGSPFSRGEVLESEPPKRLVYTWPNPEMPEAVPERLTWTIEESGPGTLRLQLVHENLPEAYRASVPSGWAAILSSLKTLLETGSPLAFHAND